MVPLTATMLAACSSSGSSSSGTGSGSSSSKITIAVQVAAPPSASVYLADDLGYFTQQGLDVKVQIVANNALQLATGQFKYGVVGTTSTITASANGTGLQQICPTVSTPNYVLAVSQKTLDKHNITASMSLKETLTALAGEQLAEIGGASNPGSVLFHQLLQKNGLDPNSIKVISQTSTASSAASFANGQVGVIFQPQPAPDQVLSRSPGKIIFQTKGSSLFAALEGADWSGIVGPTSFLSQNADLNKKVCAAIGQANNYLLDHPAEAAKTLQPQMTGFTTQQLQDGLAGYPFIRNATMSAADFSKSVTQLTDFGLVKTPSADVISKVYTTDYQG
jgi:ABC-type nitrate/sulfonate/bicarbonate transport system substrate-binding protein